MARVKAIVAVLGLFIAAAGAAVALAEVKGAGK